MAEFFNLDNPIWRFMGKVFDMMVLTVLWVVTSLPVFTIGASTTALYYAGMKLAKDQEGYVVKDFFHSFRENFRKNIGWTILMITTTTCLLAIGVFVCAPVLILSVGLCAYLHGKILYVVFKQYHFVLE